jgi:hypothetical protein
MATLTLNHFARDRFGGRRVLGILAAFIDCVREGTAIAHSYETLRRLSDNDLARLGLTRADIPRAAVNGIAAR